MNIFGNIKKVIAGYSNPNETVNPSQNLSNLVGADYSIASENKSAIGILKDESKFLKEKYNQLLKENELLKQSIFTNSNQSNSQITKIFKEFKSAFFSYESNTETNKSIIDFKNFLFQNMLLYNSLEDEDIDALNALNITDSDWNNNKDIFIFKQNVLERNYNQLMENLLVSNDLNNFLKENDLVSDNRKARSNADLATENQEKQTRSANTNYETNINYNNSSFNTINSKSIENGKRSDNTKSSSDNKFYNSLANPNEKNDAKKSKSNILEDLIKDEDLNAEVVASIFSKSVNEKIRASNENVIKPFSSNSLSNNPRALTISDNNIKQNSDKNSLKFDELLEPEIEFTNMKEIIKKEVPVGFNNVKISDKSCFPKDAHEPIRNTSKATLNTAEIISDILKDNKVNIESLNSNILGKVNVNLRENKSSLIKPGRIKSPLDDEEDIDEYESFGKINSNENKNQLNPSVIEKADINKNSLQNQSSTVNENAKKDPEKIKEKQKELEKYSYTPSKNFEDFEDNNYTFNPKQDIKESKTPFNTPMNSEQFSEPTSYSNLRLSKTKFFRS